MQNLERVMPLISMQDLNLKFEQIPVSFQSPKGIQRLHLEVQIVVCKALNFFINFNKFPELKRHQKAASRSPSCCMQSSEFFLL